MVLANPHSGLIASRAGSTYFVASPARRLSVSMDSSCGNLIFEAAVLGVPDKDWGEVGVAVVAMRPGEEMKETDVLAYLIPRTTSGKVAKAALKERLQSGSPLS